MTLLVAWRSNRGIHLMSDTRLNFGGKFADLGIKIVSAPYCVYGPGEKVASNVMARGDLGMGFAGSAVAALTLTATLRDILPVMQGAQRLTDTSMDGIVDLLWRAYDRQQKDLTAILNQNGLAVLIVVGYCAVKHTERAFMFEVDATFKRSWREVLLNVGDVEVLGSGSQAARVLLPPKPTQRDVVLAVQAVINDDQVPTVGGPIQFGELLGAQFRTVGVAEVKDRSVHHWRGGLDFNEPDLTQSNGLVIGFPLLDLICPPIGPNVGPSNGDT